MTEVTSTQNALHEEPSKNQIVCPISLKFGVVQNFRCSWKKRDGMWESRPVRGSDAWAEDFFNHVHAPKEEGGLGHPDANAIKFSHEDGVAARKQAIELVNAGKIKAPKKGWDDKFVLQGGLPKKELKEKYPEMYETKTRTKKEEDIDPEVAKHTKVLREPETQVTDEDLAKTDLDAELNETDENEIKHRQEVSEVLSSAEVEEIQEEGDGDYADDKTEESIYAAQVLAGPPVIENMGDDGYMLSAHFKELPTEEVCIETEVDGKPCQVEINFKMAGDKTQD